MTTRLALVGAACALLALAPAPARTQDVPVRDALLTARPAAPTTVARDATAASDATSPPRPNETVVVRRAPSYGRYAGRGTLIGTGIGLAVGLLAYRNNERKCRDCVGNDAIPVLVTGAGTMLGFVAGSVLWFSRATADLPNAEAAR